MNYVALAACPSVLVVPDRWLESVRINNRCVWDDYIDSPVRKFVLMLTVGIVCGLWRMKNLVMTMFRRRQCLGNVEAYLGNV